MVGLCSHGHSNHLGGQPGAPLEAGAEGHSHPSTRIVPGKVAGEPGPGHRRDLDGQREEGRVGDTQAAAPA